MYSLSVSDSSSMDDEMLMPQPDVIEPDNDLDINYVLPRYSTRSNAQSLTGSTNRSSKAEPLQHDDLRYALEHDVSDGGVSRELELMGRSYWGESQREAPFPTDQTSEMTPELATNQWERIRDRFKNYLPAAIFRNAAMPPSRSISDKPKCDWNTANLIIGREMGLGGTGRWTAAQKRGVLCPTQIPAVRNRVVYNKMDNCYTSRFTEDGELFVAGFQNKHIVVFEPDRHWAIRKEITTPILTWTITDTCTSHDGRFLLYSTISPVVHKVQIRGRDNVAQSRSNITEIHSPLHTEDDDSHMYGIWSMAWSRDNRELVIGTNAENAGIRIFDFEEDCTIASMSGHMADVNSVAFLDETCQTFVSGSDDGDIKLWDRRMFGDGGQCAGVLVGHLEGITHIDTRADGRFLISNCKDQTIKLWDIRQNVSEEKAHSYRHEKNATLSHDIWDYRWNHYPVQEYDLKHPHDASVMTFRGHEVLRTLIRAYFSPQFTTGQRYIYAGCAQGTVRIFDILTGETVQELRWHRNAVRDCAWHPYQPYLVSTSWDGHILEWIPKQD